MVVKERGEKWGWVLERDGRQLNVFLSPNRGTYKREEGVIEGGGLTENLWYIISTCSCLLQVLLTYLVELLD